MCKSRRRAEEAKIRLFIVHSNIHTFYTCSCFSKIPTSIYLLTYKVPGLDCHISLPSTLRLFSFRGLSRAIKFIHVRYLVWCTFIWTFRDQCMSADVLKVRFDFWIGDVIFKRKLIDNVYRYFSFSIYKFQNSKMIMLKIQKLTLK